MRQNRSVSKWDEKRTDQDVFIRRTLSKWFEDKCFQVVFEEYIPGDPFPLIGEETRKEPHRIKYTRYVYIVEIYFTFAKYHDQITFRFVEPHSRKIEKMCIKSFDWQNLSVEEDKESFTILRRFYPVEKSEIKLPLLDELVIKKRKVYERSSSTDRKR